MVAQSNGVRSRIVRSLVQFARNLDAVSLGPSDAFRLGMTAATLPARFGRMTAARPIHAGKRPGFVLLHTHRDRQANLPDQNHNACQHHQQAARPGASKLCDEPEHQQTAASRSGHGSPPRPQCDAQPSRFRPTTHSPALPYRLPLRRSTLRKGHGQIFLAIGMLFLRFWNQGNNASFARPVGDSSA